MISRAPVTRVVFCKDGEEVSSQIGSEEEVDYNYVHPVSRGSTGNYSCRYEIKDSDNRVTRSQLSPAQHLSITGKRGDQHDKCNCPCNGRERIQMQIAQ
ncbi:hypothetical protein G0U57_004436 [Chelydra serpentina]|uniref:Uncharacterized protein n=1 Tax=Chelydra serpentina TaxID=8475 RepID=A0A8T1S0A6_CHESE|nr:hypothetical protein G0U57_004436 [Chelydra serpentina]